MSKRGENSSPFSLFSFLNIITCVTVIMILVTLMMSLELISRKPGTPEQHSAQIVEQVKPVVHEAEQEIAELEQQLDQDEELLKELAGVDPMQLRQQLAELETAIKRLDNELAAARSQQDKAADRAQQAKAERERHADAPNTINEIVERAEEVRNQLAEIRKTNRIIYNVAPDLSKKPWLVEIGKDALIAAAIDKTSTPIDFQGAEDARAATFLSWASTQNSDSDFFMLLVKPSGISSFRKILEGLRTAGFDVGFDLVNEDQTAMERVAGASP